MVIRSYVRSTDSHCESRSQNIFSSVDVSVNIFSTALGAIPTANVQRQFINYKPTIKVAFAARKKSVNFDQFSSVPFAFIFQLTEKLTPRSITDTSGKLVVLDHVSNCQVLNSYQAIRANQACCQLVDKIGMNIRASCSKNR